MSNAGTKIETENFNKVEVFLNKDLKPMIPPDTSSAPFIICYLYRENNKELVKIVFTSKSKNYPNFEISSEFIKRFLNFNRPDETTIEILRKKSLNPNNIISLKKYAFECKKYINTY